MTTRLTPDEGPVTKTRATATLTRIPMKTLPPLLRKKFKAIKDLLVYSVPMRTRFRRVTSRDGILLHGKAGWGEAAPFWDYGPEESARWIDAAINEATVPIPFTRRKSVPVNVTVPVLGPEAAAGLRDGVRPPAACPARGAQGAGDAGVGRGDPDLPTIPTRQTPLTVGGWPGWRDEPLAGLAVLSELSGGRA